jgi:2-polyprenyl-6-methoxyphenol hydroxylase-like FAD-dependent oxidoreductase
VSLATDVDVLVLGGGPAGTACALDLSRDGYDVALIERHRYEQTRIEVIFDDYLRERKKYYGAERRWPDSIFWRRRQ